MFPIAIAIVIAAGLCAWFGVWNGQFLFDDRPAILENKALLAGNVWGAAFGPQHQPLANRPLTCLSLIADFAAFGAGPFGPHLVNLLLHLAIAVLLLSTIRRAATAPGVRGAIDARGADRIALAIATLWVVHPLGADVVAYATQRSTLLVTGFLLVAIHALLRANDGSAPRRWHAVAIAATALGMASKEDMVVAPFVLLLFDRAFLQPSWAAMRARTALHAGIAATWIVLATCVELGASNPTVGTNTSITPWQWLMTQAQVIVHYLRLVVWPHPLRGAYDLGAETDFGNALLPGAFVVALLAVTVRWVGTRPWLGWLGSMFFLMLAPTSTVLPIETEIVAERRMYLPMLFVVAPIVVVASRSSRAASPFVRTTWIAAWAAAVAVLGALAQKRVAVYADEPAFWADAYAKSEPGRRTFLAAQILSNHGAMLWQAGRYDEAHALFSAAMECPSPTANERMHFAVSLHYRGEEDEALRMLRGLVIAAPNQADVLGSLGTCLAATHFKRGLPGNDPIVEEGIRVMRRAVALDDDNAAFWNSLAYLLRARGARVEAEAAYRRVTDMSTDRVEPFIYRAELLEQLGRSSEIGPLFTRLLAARPRDADLRLHIADIDWKRRDFASVERLLNEVLAIDPGNARAAAALRNLPRSAPKRD